MKMARVLTCVMMFGFLNVSALWAVPVEHEPSGALAQGPALPQILASLRALGLGADQKQQIRAVIGTHRGAVKESFGKVKSSGAALRKAMQADQFDERAIRAAFGAFADAAEDLTVLKARIMDEVRQVLTPEQRAEFKNLQEKVQAQRRRRVAAARAFLRERLGLED
jgi:Spy/CpxP family protein refolding chaperone